MPQNTPNNDAFHYHMDILVGGFREHVARTGRRDAPRRSGRTRVRQPAEPRDQSPRRTPSLSNTPMSVDDILDHVELIHQRMLSQYDHSSVLAGMPNIVFEFMIPIGSGNQAPPPAINSAALLSKNLYYAEPSEEDNEKCGICLVKCGPTANAPQVRFPCKHRFHSECAKLWLDTSATCPYCRANLDT